MTKKTEGFLSEDGQTYTSFVEDDSDKHEENTNENVINTNDPLSDALSKIKIEELPEGQRDAFSKLVDTVKGLQNELKNSKKDTDITEVLRGLAERVNTVQKPDDTNVTKRERLADKIKIENEDKDFYAPHLKLLANAIDEILDKVGGIDKKFEETSKNTFVKNVQTFIKSNKIPEQVIRKMDEIAKSLGPGAYNDLERLHKYAKVELGIKDSPSRTTETGKVNKKNVVEFGGKRKTESVVDSKPAKNMMEAWEQAEAKLAEGDD